MTLALDASAGMNNESLADKCSRGFLILIQVDASRFTWTCLHMQILLTFFRSQCACEARLG